MKKQLLLLTMFSLWSFFSMAQITTVGIIGTSTPDGWDSDTDMVQDAGDTAVWTLDITLVDGDLKFRANDAWDINWGSTDFPTGIGVVGGDNIPVVAGDYHIDFNSISGAYTFTISGGSSFSVGIIGDATPGGWDDDTDMVQDAGDTAVWTLDVTLSDGGLKFRANDAWDINWGSPDFPTGTGVAGGDNIPVVAGDYHIDFNSNSGVYTFTDNGGTSFSVGIIGSATPGGWDDDTDMVQDAGDTAVWTLDITLTDGEAKFRANDAWDINWGSADFPTGTGVQGGDNIPVVAGDYTITFNSNTGDYSFGDQVMTGTGHLDNVGIIGSATSGGWDNDTDMIQDAGDTAVWTITIALTAGEVKFRANDAWDINWGSADFPTGTGVQGGDNIPVSTAGDYLVSFNSNTGVYSFSPDSPIGIIGSATPGGWDDDTNMFKDTSAHGYYIDINLVAGEAKFRKDDAWDVNWGSADFPTGTGVQGGDNIPIPGDGFYHVTLDTMTGAYNFTVMVQYASIGIIGSATPGGWDEDTDMVQNPSNTDEWTTDITLVDGELKFRADNAWDVNWGGGDFPNDTSSVGGDNIAATAGTYRVTFNTETLIYDFKELKNYATVGIIGDATPGGWDNDTDMIVNPDDSTQWTLTVELVDGEAKFRANNDWAVNWGGPDFPIGTAVQDGANIPVVAGRYNITFNSLTGDYNFEAFVVYDQISIVGKDGPFGQWPDDSGDFDTYMTIDENDDQLWTAVGVTLTTADTLLGDSGIKFRANTDWAVNWGERAFPIGIGTNGGPNIWCMEGTYNVSLNTQSGEYVFSDPDGTETVLAPSDISIFPNPTSELLNIDLSETNISGDISIQVFDMNGKRILSKTSNSIQVVLDLKGVKSGNYLVQITNDKYIIGKQFTVIK